ncbi:MAG: formimidoylglutamate deiminase [Planctomycetota bacterium]
MTLLEADLTWTGSAFEPGVGVELGDDGRIASVAQVAGRPVTRLARRALLPGFVNAHSHAFQRGLRGAGESFPAGVGSFWTWREAMYALVARMDAELLHTLSRQAFAEMLRSGITAVGEFHYLHHDETEDGWAFDEVVLDAARAAGIRIVLLEAFYDQGGFDQPLEPAQRRFRAGGVDAFFRNWDDRAGRLTEATQSMGVVVHSVRAATLGDLAAVSRGARDRGAVLHMHLEEQLKEIEDCRRQYGTTPTRLVLEHGVVDEHFTGVHLTHTTPEDMARFLAAGANVCVCPLTEANLGDGLADLTWVAERSGRVAVGTDSNARIDMFEELRWLELGQRLREQRRGVWTDTRGDCAPALLHAGTFGGARALGLSAGSIDAGRLADFFTVDLDALGLRYVTLDGLAAALVFGVGAEVVDRVWVGGREVRA